VAVSVQSQNINLGEIKFIIPLNIRIHATLTDSAESGFQCKQLFLGRSRPHFLRLLAVPAGHFWNPNDYFVSNLTLEQFGLWCVCILMGNCSPFAAKSTVYLINRFNESVQRVSIQNTWTSGAFPSVRTTGDAPVFPASPLELEGEKAFGYSLGDFVGDAS
jgi:hypothetical protein